jgi:3-hydroxyacyl-[acyl-carrier-protein] dehydratase
MRFSQLDRIVGLIPGQSLTAVKCLSLSEEYLKDHFPRCPLMPGVIMVEAMFQASMWLLRVEDAFRHPVVALRGARNVRFRELVEPGDLLTIETKLIQCEASRAEFNATGTVRGLTAVSGRLTLERYFLHDRPNAPQAHEPYAISEFKRLFRNLVGPDLPLDPPLRQAVGLA